MNKKSGTSKDAADKLVKGIRRKTRKQYSAEEKIRIVLAGLRGEESIAALCRRGYDAQSEQYGDMLKAGVIDSTKVVRIALEYAASVAGLLITTEAMVADKPVAANSSSMSDMGGMM